MKTFNARIDGYQVRVSRRYDLDLLCQRWVKIQSTRNVPFFLTWSWIKVWIETYDPEYLVVSATYKDEVVAIGLFTYSKEIRHKFVFSRQLRLHQIGDQLMDQIWMEYNDFLCFEQHQVKAVNACLKALQHDMFDWDEIILSMMSLNRGQEIAQSYEYAFIDVHRTCYAANLKNIKATGGNYLLSLRANTRYQIRRSIRHYEEKYGEVKLMIARNRDESIEYFHEAGPLHIERWDDSGYKNKQFINFHENLIRESDDHQIDLIRVRAGNTTIAVMYYHIVGKNVYFYLHGLKYDDDAKLKPGLVAHSLASQHYLDAGMDIYDYMGGYSQYKLQLAERIEDLVTVCIQKSKLRFAIENFSRNVKQFVLSRN